MVGSQSIKRAEILSPRLPRGGGFLLGAVLAALLVLAIGGGSLTLSRTLANARGEIADGFGHDRLSRPALSLRTVQAGRPDGALG
jgi:hypothetical protein